MKQKIISFLCIVGFLGCTQSDSMELQGRVAMKGSARHSYLTIYDQKTHKSYKIQNQKDFDLIHKQNKSIKLEATLVKKASGPGFPATIEVTDVIED